MKYVGQAMTLTSPGTRLLMFAVVEECVCKVLVNWECEVWGSGESRSRESSSESAPLLTDELL